MIRYELTTSFGMVIVLLRADQPDAAAGIEYEGAEEAVEYLRRDLERTSGGYRYELGDSATPLELESAMKQLSKYLPKLLEGQSIIARGMTQHQFRAERAAREELDRHRQAEERARLAREDQDRQINEPQEQELQRQAERVASESLEQEVRRDAQEQLLWQVRELLTQRLTARERPERVLREVYELLAHELEVQRTKKPAE